MKRVYTYDEPVIVEEEPMYIVESILDQKTIKNKKYFLVKWVGWPEESATWEPYQQIKHLEQIIKQFKKRGKMGQKNETKLTKQGAKEAITTNPFESTQKNGHFIYGDKPRQILSVDVVKLGNHKSIYLYIQWMPRSDGTVPNISRMPIATACEYEPLFLFDFLEKHIEFDYRPSPQGQNMNEEECGNQQSERMESTKSQMQDYEDDAPKRTSHLKCSKKSSKIQQVKLEQDSSEEQPIQSQQ